MMGIRRIVVLEWIPAPRRPPEKEKKKWDSGAPPKNDKRENIIWYSYSRAGIYQMPENWDVLGGAIELTPGLAIA